MHTQSIQWEKGYSSPLAGPRGPALDLYEVMDRALIYVLGTVLAYAVLIGAIFLVNDPGRIPYLQAAICTSGFLFAGLAMEAEKASTAWLALATGLLLPALAWSSRSIGPEPLIIAAGVIAAWSAVAFFQFDRIARR